MDIDTVVRALRDAECNTDLDCEINELRPTLTQAADLIDSLTAQLSVPQQKGASYWKTAWESQCNENKLLYAQLAASQRREKAEDELMHKVYFAADDAFCSSCREIVGMIEATFPQEAEKGEAE